LVAYRGIEPRTP